MEAELVLRQQQLARRLVDAGLGHTPRCHGIDHRLNRHLGIAGHEQDIVPRFNGPHGRFPHGQTAKYPVHVEGVCYEEPIELHLPLEQIRHHELAQRGGGMRGVERRQVTVEGHHATHAGVDRGLKRTQLHAVETRARHVHT